MASTTWAERRAENYRRQQEHKQEIKARRKQERERRRNERQEARLRAIREQQRDDNPPVRTIHHGNGHTTFYESYFRG